MSEVDDEKRLPFTEHLRELRDRLIWSVGAILVGFLAAWAFHEELFYWLMEPYIAGAGELYPEFTEAIAFRSPIEPIVVYLKTSLLVAVICTLPFILWQTWLFVAPGLYKHERRMAVPFLGSSILCFVGGALFCRYLVLEPALTVLLGMGGSYASPNIMMQEYFGFTSRMLLVFGLLFELPVAISFLSLIGLVTHRGLIRNWRYAILIAFVVGAMLTPPDPLTQMALAVPLAVLYLLSIIIAYFITTSRERGGADKAPDIEEGAE